MKDKVIKTLCDHVDMLAIGAGLVITGITCGVWGYMAGKYH